MNYPSKLRSAFRLFIVSAAAAASVFTQGTAPADIEAKADQYMNALVSVKGIGGSILLARDGKVLVAKGYGTADRDANLPNGAETKHRIGSLTKQFTAAAVMLLVDRGQLAVTDSACKYIANCPDQWRTVTVHQLLTHTSGIPNFTAIPDWPAKRAEDLAPSAVLDLVRSLPLKFAPGENFEYSNTNYTLLGLVIEKISGMGYDEFLTKNILEPLKLTSTGYDHGTSRIKGSSLGYSKRGEEVVPAAKISMRPPYAAGAMYSTVADLYRWQEALRGEKLLSRKSLDAMFTPVKNNYGYGIARVRPPVGRERLTHAGGIEGYSSNIGIFPNENAAVIVLLNNDSGSAARSVSADLEAILFGESYSLPKERKAISVDTKLLDAYAGKYSVAPGLDFVIARKGDGLTFQPTGQPMPADMYAESETRFFLKVVDAEITFIRDAAGKVTGLEFLQRGRTTRARRSE